MNGLVGAEAAANQIAIFQERFLDIQNFSSHRIEARCANGRPMNEARGRRQRLAASRDAGGERHEPLGRAEKMRCGSPEGASC
jgi:hypothetical protein